MLDLIDQMRVSIPEEIKKAQQLLSNRDRLLAQAQEEASRTVQLARDRADQVVDRDPIVQAAQVRAEQIIAQARAEAELTRREADDYVQTSLSNLLKELERLTSQVADALVQHLHPQGVMVVIECEHQCMTMRGVRKPGSRTVTSAVRGVMNHAATRAEAMGLVIG